MVIANIHVIPIPTGAQLRFDVLLTSIDLSFTDAEVLAQALLGNRRGMDEAYQRELGQVVRQRSDLVGFTERYSDHGARILQEIEPAIVLALQTAPSCPFLEIGTREGGSTVATAWHLKEEGRGRVLVTNDVSPGPDALKRVQGNLHGWRVPWVNFYMDTADLIRLPTVGEYAYIFHDGAHDRVSVLRDVEALAPKLTVGGVLVIDDVNDIGEPPPPDWWALRGLEEVRFPGVDSNHIRYWRKTLGQ